MKSPPQSGTLIEFGPFTLDKALGKLSKHGTPIRLRGMPLKVLNCFVERPGEVVSRGELQRLLWGGTAFGDFEQGLNTAVNVVRKTLSDSADQPRYIETVAGHGYRFIAPLHSGVAVLEAPASNSALDTRSIAPDMSQGVEGAGEIRDAPAGWNATARRRRWGIVGALTLAAFGVGAFWTFQSKPQALFDGSTPSANHEANDQYNLAMNFLVFQNDIPLARKTFKRALELDAHFASARLQHANMQILEIWNGYTNDESVLYRAEEEVHQAERVLPASDGLLLGVKSTLYLAQGRLDRIPWAKLEEWWRNGANNGQAPPQLVVILRMLGGQSEEPLAMVRTRLERNPMENPTRMLLGELLRTRGDAPGAIHTLERVLQQAPRHLTPAWFLTMAYIDNGQPEQARALLEGMRREFEKNYMWRHAWAILLAAEGKREEALQAMDEGTLKFARLTWPVTSTTADFYALQGDRAKAIEWLQLAVARGDERVSYFRRNRRLATLRDDPRFQSILKSVEARRK
jgi:DNA-binding winged helix-turn-helix (wHTH) protein/tetratricopeptide (TPR) repeat protein